MPYIEKRDVYESVLDGVLGHINYYTTPGALNYMITRLCQVFSKRKNSEPTYAKRKNSKPTYADYNEIIGVLECAKLEFYRRAVAAYEDEKIKENGDVY